MEAFVTPFEGLQLEGSGTFLKAEQGAGSRQPWLGERLAGVPTVVGNLAAIYSPGRGAGLQFKADWHWVGWRLSETPLDRIAGIELPAYNYFNFGVGYADSRARAQDQRRSAERIPEQGPGGGQPAARVGRPTTLFLCPAAAASAAAGVDQYDFGGGQSQTAALVATREP